MQKKFPAIISLSNLKSSADIVMVREDKIIYNMSHEIIHSITHAFITPYF